MSMPNNGRTDKLLTFHCIKIEVASKKTSEVDMATRAPTAGDLSVTYVAN